MAQPQGPRGGRFECYTARSRGSSGQGGAVITPWERPEPSPPHPALESFSTPRAYEPPHLAALKEDLALGRALLPRVLSTVSARPGSPRVAQALGSLQVFDAIETEATAYDASIAAGPAQLVVATNFKVAVLSKTGEPPPVETSLRAWFASGLARSVREGALR